MSSAEDHATGLELQLIELVERRERALVQGRESDAGVVQREIDEVVAELAGTADAITPSPGPHFHDVNRAAGGWVTRAD
ncbi:MAG TPA: hypothetical protein VFP54_00305 [Acidimicrobiales bacterium]|nr:hypothetical protein [Acidimicrobiales bacterium]